MRVAVAKLAVRARQAQRHLGRRREDGATVGQHDPVTSLPLGLIKRGVGRGNQRIASGDMERHCRNADRSGDVVQWRAVGDHDLHGTNRFQHRERARLRHFHGGARQQHQEFLAAEAADDIGLADGFQQGLAEFALLYYASWALYEPLLHAGVSIREYQLSLMHAKVAVFDRRVACVGSSNIDPLSLLMAREANVFVDDAAFAERLSADLLEAMDRGSTAVEVRSWTRLPLWQRLRVWLCYRCARLLLTLYGYDRLR